MPPTTSDGYDTPTYNRPAAIVKAIIKRIAPTFLLAIATDVAIAANTDTELEGKLGSVGM